MCDVFCFDQYIVYIGSVMECTVDIFALTVFGERLQREMLPAENLSLRETTV